MHKETYESIRKGACFEEVMANCMYYLDLMKRKGLPFTWRYCPMRQNWKEIPETVSFCNEKGITLMYNQVDSPLNFSLHTLPAGELQAVIDYFKEHIPPVTTVTLELENRKNYLELIQRLEGFLIPENRLNGLRSRLDISKAVISQYTRDERQKAKANRVPLVQLEESTNSLVQAAKGYVATRINVDQALETEATLPGDVLGRLSEQLAGMHNLSKENDGKVFIKVFLNELMRTYSGVWGVSPSDVHVGDVFDWIEQFSVALSSRADQQQVINNIVSAPPGDLYDLLASSRSSEEVTKHLLTRYTASEGQLEELAWK
jgi:hypothetical protein